MASTFPTSIDTIGNAPTAQTLGGSVTTHAQAHDILRDAIIAAQTRLGVSGSSDPASVENRLQGAIDDAAAAMPNTATAAGLLLANAAPKATPVDADLLFVSDSEASGVAKGLPISSLRSSVSGNIKRTNGGIFCDWGSYAGALTLASANAGESVAIDPAVSFGGKSAIKCILSTTNSAVYIARWTPTNTISLKNFRSIQIPYLMTGVDGTCSHGFAVWLKCASGKQVRLTPLHTRTLPLEWRIDTWVRATVSGTVSFSGGATDWTVLDNEQINAIDIVATAHAASSTYPFWVGPLRVNATAEKGIVSIRLDGEYSSQSSIILPIFNASGIKASLALTHSDIGSGGRMSSSEISAAYAAGHEVMLHTYDATKVNGYANATDWPNGYQITNDIAAGFYAANQNGWKRGNGALVEGFSGNYFNSSTSAGRQKILKTAFAAAGVDIFLEITSSGMLNASHGPNGYFNPVIHCQKSITSADTPETVKSVIDSAISGREWAVIVMHQAVADGVTPSGNQMNASNVQDWVSYLAAAVEAGTVLVMPVTDAYKALYK